MKITHILSASVLAGAVLLSATACGSGDNNEAQPANSTSASASASATPTKSANSDSTSAPTNTVEASAEGVKVGMPTEVKLSEVTSNSLKASWAAPTNTLGRVTQYTIVVKENGVTKATYYSADTSYKVTGLSSNNAYMVEVSAVAVSDDGAKQATSAATTSNTVVTSSDSYPVAPAPAPAVPVAPVPAPAPAVPVAPVPAPAPPTTSDKNSAEAKKIVDTVTGYYRFVGSAGSLDKVKAAGKDYYGSEKSEADLKKFVASFPEGFRYFDTSSSEKVNNAYSQLFARATQSERTPGTTVTVPEGAVTVDGSKATVDSTKVIVTSNSQTKSGAEAPYFENRQLHLVKKSDGSWVMIAETPRQSIP